MVPIVAAFFSPEAWVARTTSAITLAALLVLGGVAAHAGGALVAKGALRVAFWGALAMALSAAVGDLAPL